MIRRLAPIALFYVACSRAPELPRIDTAGMEPRVATRIQAAHAAAGERPSDARAWGRLAQLLDAHGELAIASRVYAHAHLLDATEFRWIYGRACCAHELRRPLEELEQHFAAAAALKPGHAPLYCRWGDARMNGGQAALAEEAYREALVRDGDLARAQRGLGHALLAQDRAREGLLHLERALALAPQDSVAWAALARAHARLGEAAQARAAAARADAGQPLEFMEDGYRDEVRLASVSTASLLSRAENALLAGDFRSSAEHLRAVAQARPTDPWVRRNLALALRRGGHHEEARAAALQAIELAPDFALAYLELGKLDEMRQHWSAAEGRYRDVVRLQPTFEEGWTRLAATLFKAERYDEALTVYGEADRRCTLGAGTLADWAVVRLEVDDVEGGIVLYERALKLDPQHTRASQGLTGARAHPKLR